MSVLTLMEAIFLAIDPSRAGYEQQEEAQPEKEPAIRVAHRSPLVHKVGSFQQLGVLFQPDRELRLLDYLRAATNGRAQAGSLKLFPQSLEVFERWLDGLGLHVVRDYLHHRIAAVGPFGSHCCMRTCNDLAELGQLLDDSQVRNELRTRTLTDESLCALRESLHRHLADELAKQD